MKELSLSVIKVQLHNAIQNVTMQDGIRQSHVYYTHYVLLQFQSKQSKLQW